ncbi:hypothetical protein GCM10009099_30310 [Caenispirillum bisanense]
MTLVPPGLSPQIIPVRRKKVMKEKRLRRYPEIQGMAGEGIAGTGRPGSAKRAPTRLGSSALPAKRRKTEALFYPVAVERDRANSR